MACSKCSCSSCSWLSVLAGIIAGIIVGALYFTEVITAPTVFLWILLGFAVGSLVFFIIAQLAAALFESSLLAACLCRNSNCLLLSAIGTVVLVAITFLSNLTTTLATAILLGITTIFATLLFISIASLLSCISSRLCSLGTGSRASAKKD